MRRLPLLLGTLLLAGCMSRIEPGSISIGETTTARMPSKINFLHRKRERWQVVTGTIDKKAVERIFEQGLGMLAAFDDCQGQSLGEDDVYVNGVSMYQVSMNRAEFTPFYNSLSNPVVFVTRIREERYSQSPAVCLELRGADMVGQGLKSASIKLK